MYPESRAVFLCDILGYFFAFVKEWHGMAAEVDDIDMADKENSTKKQ